MLITFVFLGLITKLKPYSADSLGSLQTCALFAEFITLFSGVLLIIDEYLEEENNNAGASNSDVDYQIKIVAALIFASNFLVMSWPVFQLYMLFATADSSQNSSNLCNVCSGSDESKKTLSVPSLVFASSEAQIQNEVSINSQATGSLAYDETILPKAELLPEVTYARIQTEAQQPIETASSISQLPMRIDEIYPLELDEIYKEVILFKIFQHDCVSRP